MNKTGRCSCARPEAEKRERRGLLDVQSSGIVEYTGVYLLSSKPLPVHTLESCLKAGNLMEPILGLDESLKQSMPW